MDIEKVKEYLVNLDDDELLSLHREFLEANNYGDDEVYSMEEFDELLNNETAWNVAQKCYYGEFCPNDSYFKFDGGGNLQSDDYLPNLINIDDLAQWLIDTNHSVLEDIED